MKTPDLRPFLEEDVGSGDVTADIFLPEGDGKAVIACEEDCIVAGLDEAVTIFAIGGVKTREFVKDGDSVKAGTVILEADEIVEPGELEPDQIHVPGVLVDYVVQNTYGPDFGLPEEV